MLIDLYNTNTFLPKTLFDGYVLCCFDIENHIGYYIVLPQKIPLLLYYLHIVQSYNNINHILQS